MREGRDGFMCTTAELLHTYQLKWKVFVVLLFAFLIKALLSSSILSLVNIVGQYQYP